MELTEGLFTVDAPGEVGTPLRAMLEGGMGGARLPGVENVTVFDLGGDAKGRRGGAG